MYIVTGGAGFIGSNIVKALNDRNINDIIVVDDLTEGQKVVNLADLNIADFLDKEDFIMRLAKGVFGHEIKGIFHQGACSDTTEMDGRKVMTTNYEYSKALFAVCLERQIPFIYASSASVYGLNHETAEERTNEHPLNPYAFSKFQFDQFVRQHLPQAKSQVVGLRYFNVYGPREQHKGSMASVAYHFNQQVQSEGIVKLFEGSGGYGNGEQQRDFIFVDDVVKVNLWFLDNPLFSGIFNCGTGTAKTFNSVAQAVLDWHGKGDIQYIPFPEHLKGRYQHFTQAKMDNLHSISGFDVEFTSVENGVKVYLDWLNKE